MDPRQFKSEKELEYAYITAWGLAQASQEIVDFVAKAIEETKYLTDKEQDKLPADKLREALS